MKNKPSAEIRIDAPITLRVASGLQDTHPWEQALHRWADKVRKESGGKVGFNFIDASQSMFGTGGPPDVQSGGLSDRRRRKFLNADIVGSNAAVLGLSLGQVLPLFFYGTDIVTAREVFNELWEKYPEISEEYTGQNIKRLFGHGEVDFHLQTKYKPVRTLRDFAGSRICVLLGELYLCLPRTIMR